MKKFEASSQNSQIVYATEVSNEIIQNVADYIRRYHPEKIFIKSNITGEQLAELIEKSTAQMEVCDWWYWRAKVLGMYDASQPSKIFINTKSLPRASTFAGSVASIVATIVHEYIHYLDLMSDEFYFGHGNNKYQGWKHDTAPYFCDFISAKEAMKFLGAADYLPINENENIITKKPWWRRLIFWR